MESSSEKLSVAEEDAIVDSVVNSFALTDETLEEVVRLLSAEMNRGLDARTHDSADVKMFPTFVTGIPNGTEKGDYLAIDFGRSNFRILWVHLPGIFEERQGGTRPRRRRQQQRSGARRRSRRENAIRKERAARTHAALNWSFIFRDDHRTLREYKNESSKNACIFNGALLLEEIIENFRNI